MADNNLQQQYDDLDRDYRALDKVAREQEIELNRIRQEERNLKNVHAHCSNANLAGDYNTALADNKKLIVDYNHEREERKIIKRYALPGAFIGGAGLALIIATITDCTGSLHRSLFNNDTPNTPDAGYVVDGGDAGVKVIDTCPGKVSELESKLAKCNGDLNSCRGDLSKCKGELSKRSKSCPPYQPAPGNSNTCPKTPYIKQY